MEEKGERGGEKGKEGKKGGAKGIFRPPPWLKPRSASDAIKSLQNHNNPQIKLKSETVSAKSTNVFPL